jgi:hypothetical protein
MSARDGSTYYVVALVGNAVVAIVAIETSALLPDIGTLGLRAA